jgi:L-lactate dehydrogenase complex protein LldG
MSASLPADKNARQSILDRIRSREVPPRALPPVFTDGIRYPDRWANFQEVLLSGGGQFLNLTSPADVATALQRLPIVESARCRVCAVSGWQLGHLDLNTVNDPRDLAGLDLAIFPGHFAVAENGAVWVTDASIRHRAALFIAQHLLLVVPQSECVDNMHQAYERLAFGERGYGLFISGPSKTADIEQSLVIGAHGPRSLTVVVVP